MPLLISHFESKDFFTACISEMPSDPYIASKKARFSFPMPCSAATVPPSSMALFAKLNPEPVFRFNDDGYILQSNPAANDIFLLESIVKMQIRELVPEISDINFREFIDQNSLLTITAEIGEKIILLLHVTEHIWLRALDTLQSKSFWKQ